MNRLPVIFLAALAVQGCYPTAESTDDFPVVAKTTVTSVPGFRDCMMDGLNPMEGWVLNRRDVQQEVRSDGVRIDTSVAAGGIQLSRTEIFDDGKAHIRIASYYSVSLIDRSPERDIFDQCAKRYQ
jgi:hypothetical protein